jgi:lambda family phage portal protein
MSRQAEIEALVGPPNGVRRDFEAQADTPSALPVPVGRAGGVSASIGGAYEGANRVSRELALWSTPIRSADREILPDKAISDARARDSLHNDAYVAGGANIHRDSIVGALYRLNAKPKFKVLGLDEKWSTEFQEEVEAKFTLGVESPMNWIDAARYNTLTSLIRLAVGIYVYGGEVLASVEWLRDGQTRPFNTAIQLIELDRLSSPFNLPESPDIRGGIERNKYGAPQAYHIRLGHPTDYNDPDSYLWKRVPIRKPWGRMQVIHIVEQQRPDQTRGIAEMVAALKELRITKKFRDIVLQQAIVNATYAATIESELPSEAVFAQLGGGNVSEAIVNFTDGYLGAVTQYVGTSKNMHIDGVKIPHLFPGTKLNVRPVSNGGPLGAEFESSLLRYIAATLGVSYEQLSRDYTKTNYSSARAAMTETWKFMLSRKRMVADRFASHIYQLWLEEQLNKNNITALPRNAPSFYDPLMAEAYSFCDWIGASRGQIDELKETQAAVLRLTHNLSTYEDEHGRLGGDWREKFAQIAREKKLMAELDITPVATDATNSMMNATTGKPRDGQPKDKTAGAPK